MRGAPCLNVGSLLTLKGSRSAKLEDEEPQVRFHLVSQRHHVSGALIDPTFILMGRRLPDRAWTSPSCLGPLPNSHPETIIVALVSC